MKKINIYRLSVIVFIIILIISAITYAKVTQQNIAKSVLRLHIVANSDSEADQRLKLLVRDRVLSEAAYLFEDTVSAEAAEKIAKENIDYLTEIARDEIKKHGYAYSAKVQVGKFPFPVKIYDDIMLPSGQYTALKIIIGEGKGQNWWCVMYPPMCTLEGITMSTGRKKLEGALSQEEYKIISSDSQTAQIRFRIVDMINSFL